VIFYVLASYFLLRALITAFADATRLAPSLDLPLENPDEDMEYYLCRVGFLFPSFYSVMLVLIDYFTSHALALSKKGCEKMGAELV
jgi:hypothetical protein